MSSGERVDCYVGVPVRKTILRVMDTRNCRHFPTKFPIMKFPPPEVRKHHQKVLRLKDLRLNWRGKRWANRPPSAALSGFNAYHPPSCSPRSSHTGFWMFPAFLLPAMSFQTSAGPIPLPPAGLYSNSTFSGRPLYLNLQPNPSTTFCTYHDILFSVFMVCLSLLDNL